MKPKISSALAALLVAASCLTLDAQTPDNLVLDGIPAIPADLRRAIGPFLESRAAIFRSWHPTQHEILITTRFADTMQLHQVRMPGGAREQLTFSSEPVGESAFRPKSGESIVFSQDTGGGEFFQLYRYDRTDGRITLLTDGQSRNTGMKWSHSGQSLAYASTRRNGKDTDIYLLDPAEPKSARMLAEVAGGGWAVEDWSADDSKLILIEYLSINQSRLYLADARTGRKELLIADTAGDKVAYRQARFAPNGKAVYLTTDKDSEFQRLAKLDLESKQLKTLTAQIPWDVSEFEVCPDGRTIAFVVNEEGVSRLQQLDTNTEQLLPTPPMPAGVIAGLKWHTDGKSLAFTSSSAQSPSDVYSLDLGTNGWHLVRWTQSETGGLNPAQFVEPVLAKMKSYDGLPISAFVYRPNSAKFPGKRPVMINIHGGPESQARPIFQARINYFVNELGIAVIYPNVRGSAGYGKGFLTLDNGAKREDSVRDIGTVLDWVEKDSGFDPERIGVMGGSYGGYMTLACLVHFGDRLRCGVDVVGISNFITFLKSTQEYRRDLRRVEYGDEREESMKEFLERISPLNNVKKIKKPLLVVQGKNDPRVPLAEAEQMVKALRDQGSTAWYLMANDEGHGFAKKKNADFQFLTTVFFLQNHLLN